MDKINNVQEYYIYNEQDELEDVVTFSKKELLVYKRKYPLYTVEPVGVDYNFKDEDWKRKTCS